MKKTAIFLFMVLFTFCTLGIAFAGSHYVEPNPKRDPPGSVHMAYEWENFTPGKPNVHLPGADLQGPGDSYRYTVIRDDKYANNPDYEVVNAVVGVHIDDYDWSAEKGDTKQEWGKILVDGKASKYKAILPTDKRKPGSSEFMEMISDAEITPKGRPLFPPYIFSITAEMKKSKTLVMEIVNLRKDGSINSNAPYGNFVVNRIGVHVWYKKK